MKKIIVCCLALFLFLRASVVIAASPDFEPLRFSLVASPDMPYPGETVRIRTENFSSNFSPGGKFDETQYGIRWEWQGGVSDFRVESSNTVTYEMGVEPATLSASFWDRLGGSDLGTAALTITPQRHSLTVNNLTPEETVQLWDEATKSMMERRGRMVKSKVALDVVLEPVPQKELRYQWTSNEGTILTSEVGNHCLVYRETPGRAEVTVIVSDRNNVTLGQAIYGFNVDISYAMLERSRQLVRGWERWRNALALREKGEIESAFVQARQAAEELLNGGVKDDVLRSELERFKQVRDNYFHALELASLAASLWRDGKLEEALTQYRQARAFYAHASIEKNITEIETLLEQAQAVEDSAATLVKEAERLEKAGDLEGALEKYKESLRLRFNPQVRAAQTDVEALQKAIQRKKEVAEAVREVGVMLEAQENLDDALTKMIESREIWELPTIAADVKRIQGKIMDQLRWQNESARLSEAASVLEARGLQDQGDPKILREALSKYHQALDVWRDSSFERSIERVTSHIARIDDDVAQATFAFKEGALLEESGRLEEALNKYRRAQDIRRTGDAERKIGELTKRIETKKKLALEAQAHYAQATKLEKGGNLDGALESARRGEALLSANGLTVKDLPLDELEAGDIASTVKRLENTLGARNSKIARAAELAAQARQESHPEKALDLFRESENLWHNEEVAQMIRTLQELLRETRDAEERAADLYKEAVVLDRESKFEEAKEKLQSSITLKRMPEAEKLLTEVQKKIIEKNWIETLLPQPLELKALPLIPYLGERTTVRIEGGAWTVDEGLTYRWKVSGNVKDNAPVGQGHAYGFYPADGQPVTVALTVLQAGKERELATRTLSLVAEPRYVRLTVNEKARTAKLWNTTLKRLEEANEFSTGTDMEIQAEVIPLAEGAVSYFWSADPDSILVASLDSGVVLRRPSPGMSRVNVMVKDSRGIILGNGQIDFLVAVDKSEIARDFKRFQAWERWTEAKDFWSEGRRLQAIDKATEASSLDPLDPDISSGLSQMKGDVGKMEQAARLLSESSLLLAGGQVEEAEAKIGEAERLWSNEKNKDIRYDLSEAWTRRRRNVILAENLRAEGDALLAQGSKVEALLRFQDSFLLTENDAVSKDILRLTQEIAEEKAQIAKARDLREKGYTLVDRKHYSEALEYFTRSLTLHADPYLTAYMDTLREWADRERVARVEASRLRGEGDALMKDKKTTEALVKYKASLRVWYDDELAALIKKEEDRIAEARASQLRKDAEALIKQKKNVEALAKYKESLTYAHNDTAASYVKKAEDAEAKRRADALIKEGDALVKQKQSVEALQRYRLAQADAPNDKALQETIRKLELMLAPVVAETPLSENGDLPEEPSPDENTSSDQGDTRDLVQADALFKEGNELYKQKKYREALQRYKESYKLSQSPKLLDFANQLETTLDNMEKANTLVQEANALYKAQKYEEALARYKESLNFHANSEVATFILKVETLLK
ncbi:MAG: hypothetical protein LBJ36_04515 [Synergistaceae bacterium]|jgi:tetratricopeptide (TPR) repeat protein|nr:hypothetical protein [Synergistaceae bacterium]